MTVERPSNKRGQGRGYLWILAHLNHSGDDCLPWPFGRDDKGYGQLGHEGRLWKAHRLMCILARGEPPTPRHQASHNCGSGDQGCVNPKHLEWKTNSENQLDRKAHGKKTGQPFGPKGKLTPEQICQIQAERGRTTIRTLAARYGVKRGAIDYWHKLAKQGRGYTANLVDHATVSRKAVETKRINSERALAEAQAEFWKQMQRT